MGTRADFYVRNEKSEPKMEWLGSTGFDGYPDGIEPGILKSTTEQEFRNCVTAFFNEEDCSTTPEQGWPWPWNDSRTTDYSYIFENGKVMASCFGNKLFDPLIKVEDDEVEDFSPKIEGYFPDMSDIKNVTFGKRSGAIFISTK